MIVPATDFTFAAYQGGEYGEHVTICGDVRDALRLLPDECVQCVVTSPPYWGLRDYGVKGQIGLESTPEEHVATMVKVFREVRRVLRNDGTLWLNLGDSYASGKGSCFNPGGGDNSLEGHAKLKERGVYKLDRGNKSDIEKSGLKPKDLVGIPWMVAFALRADGWWLRMDNIWVKPNPMPESVTDRTTKAHEYMFHLSKSARYYYDAIAIREPKSELTLQRLKNKETGLPGKKNLERTGKPFLGKHRIEESGRNKRSVWTVPTAPFSKAHFATFPPKLIQPCILAGSSNRACEHCGAPWIRVTETRDHANSLGKSWNDGTSRLQIGQRGCPSGDKAAVVVTIGWQPTCKCDSEGSSSSIILDPFGGSGTTAVVANHYGRRSITIELNEEYAAMRDDDMAQEVLKL